MQIFQLIATIENLFLLCQLHQLLEDRVSWLGIAVFVAARVIVFDQ